MSASERVWARDNVGRPYGDARGPLVRILGTEVHPRDGGYGWVRGVVIGHMNPRPDFRRWSSGETINWWGRVQ